MALILHSCNSFNYPAYVRNTVNSRNRSMLIPHARTTRYGLKSIKNIGARIWNDIPLPIRSSVNKNYFKKSRNIIINIFNFFSLSYIDLIRV